MKRVRWLSCLIVLLLALPLVFAECAQPPVSGDWIIDYPFASYEFCTFNLNGNLVVTSSGSLNISNGIIDCKHVFPQNGSSTPKPVRHNLTFDGPVYLEQTVVLNCGVDAGSLVATAPVTMLYSTITESTPLILKGDDNIIIGSVFQDSVPYGRSLFGRSSGLLVFDGSDGNVVQDTSFFGVGDGDRNCCGYIRQPPGLFQIAVSVKQSSGLFERNIFKDSVFGLMVLDSGDLIVRNNNFSLMAAALGDSGSDALNVTGNLFKDVSVAGVVANGTGFITVSGNTFVNTPSTCGVLDQFYGQEFPYVSIGLSSLPGYVILEDNVIDSRCAGIVLHSIGSSIGLIDNNISSDSDSVFAVDSHLTVFNSSIGSVYAKQDSTVLLEGSSSSTSAAEDSSYVESYGYMGIDVVYPPHSLVGTSNMIVLHNRDDSSNPTYTSADGHYSQIYYRNYRTDSSGTVDDNNHTIELIETSIPSQFVPKNYSIDLSGVSHLDLPVDEFWMEMNVLPYDGQYPILENMPGSGDTTVAGTVLLEILTNDPRAVVAYWFIWGLEEYPMINITPETLPDGTKRFTYVWDTTDWPYWPQTWAGSTIEGLIGNELKDNFTVIGSMNWEVTVDNLAPERINNLQAITDRDFADIGKIDVVWTAPIDLPGNYETPGWSKVTEYKIKYSAVNITNEAGWESATSICENLTVQNPGVGQVCPFSGVSGGNLYYFAVKSKDEYGRWSNWSNSAVAPTAGGNDISVDYAVALKNGYDVSNISNPVTVYKYDSVLITAKVKNRGPITEYNVPVRIIHYGDTPPEEQEVYINLSAGETREVNLTWIADPESGGYQHIGVKAESTFYDEDGLNNEKGLFFDVWSVKEKVSVQHSVGKPSYSAGLISVKGDVWHNISGSPTFYGIKGQLSINYTPIIVNSTTAMWNCNGEACYTDLYYGTAPTNIWWKINDIPTGSYEVNISIGEHEGDIITTSKIFNR